MPTIDELLIRVGPADPLWESWNSLDWDTLMFSRRWVYKLKYSHTVILVPPASVGEALLARMVKTITKHVKEVRVLR